MYDVVVKYEARFHCFLKTYKLDEVLLYLNNSSPYMHIVYSFIMSLDPCIANLTTLNASAATHECPDQTAARRRCAARKRG